MQAQQFQPSSLYGNCHRCGAPKAPMMIGGGVTMICCTRCTSAEDQAAQIEAIAMAERYQRQLSAMPTPSFWQRARLRIIALMRGQS